MKRRKLASWQVIGVLAMQVALLSMACSLSVGAPNFSGSQGAQPTFTSQAPVEPLPTMAGVTPGTNGTTGNNNGTNGTATQSVGSPTQLPDLTQTPGGTGNIPSTGGPAQAPGNLTDIYAQANPGTVSILVGVNQGGQQGEGAGSGFVLTQDGYIATNFHVAGDAQQIVVRFFNDADMQAKLVGGDPDSDLAIIKVDRLPQGVHPLQLGDSSKVKVGEGVVAIGNPFALGTSMSYGIVSAVGRTIPSISQQYNIPQAIQTDAAINPGNSGGPLINMRGEVIGINAQIRTSGTSEGNIGIGFSIPVNILKLVYPTLIKSGTYTWPYLGIGSPQNSPLSTNLDNPQTAQGAVIAEVIQGGPAEQAGLRANDVVTAADGQKITIFDQLLAYVMTKRPGDKVQLTVMRGSQQGQVTVTLGERPHGQNNNQ